MVDFQKNIAIIVLAAGASKRMGEPKQLLKWGTTTLIGHAIETAKETGLKDIIVVLGAHVERIEKAIDISEITLLNHKNWHLGLGSSIAFAVQYLQEVFPRTDGVLITLCDQPFITSDFLKNLIATFQPNKKQIVTSTYANGKLGVPVLFDKLYFSELMQLRDDQGAKALLQKYQINLKTIKPPYPNRDLDTKADYTTLYRSNFKK